MWKELIHGCDEKTAVHYNEPATEDQLRALEENFQIQLPEDLRSYLLESNGDDTLIMSAQRIVDVNSQLKEECADTHMPLDCLFFVAENGCGGYYAYPVIRGEIKKDRIYFWWQETDDRTMVADSLKDFLVKYYNGEI